jgi:predicted small lipoprotein YifL
VNRTWRVLGVALATALAGCGQKGPLYLPEKPGNIVTRPAQTPPAPPPSAPGAGATAESPNSPQTADSPENQASPAPEVVLPSPAERDEKKKQEAARPK